jgi:hemolysin III
LRATIRRSIFGCAALPLDVLVRGERRNANGVLASSRVVVALRRIGAGAPERAFMSQPDARPLPSKRTYSPAEIVADGAVHAAALIAGAFAFWLLFAMAPAHSGLNQRLAMAIYAAGYFIMFGFSFAYNMTPESPLKRVLRRCDHSAIYLMIAGTYSALLSQVRSGLWVDALAAFVWTGAIVGAALKLFLPGRFERISTGVYLGLGWSAIVAIRPLTAAFPAGALALVIGGGLVYSIGVVFYRWHSLKFQNAIWHAFVAVAAACQFAGILEMVARGA